MLRPELAFNGVKIFSATMFAQRQQLGEHVTQWLADHSDLVVTEMVVTQSSDAAFHCITITVFFWEDTRGDEEAPADPPAPRSRRA